MDILKNINLLLTGSPNEHSLQQRIFTNSSFWTSIIGILFAVFSIIENQPMQIALSFIATISFLSLYYFSRRKNRYNKWLFLIILLSYISLNWFFFNGLKGPSLFIFILGILTFYGIFERKYYFPVFIIVILNVIAVWYIGLKFPNLMISNIDYKPVYTIISFVVTSFFAGLIISQLKFNYAIEHQKTEIEKKELEYLHNNILGSIRYAENIQKALLPSPAILTEGLHNYFVLFKPKDVVSGDFYWVKKIANKTIFAVADCTGHGVPGAFMSMLAISYLNEIVINNNTLRSDEILNRLRRKVKKAFSQNKELSVNDGLDIALCIIDFDKMQVQFSGAFNPLFLIRNNQLIEYKADKQPIGVYPKETDFSYKEIDLQKNDMLYLFSDGYKDQSGGKNGKKFMAKQFKELLRTIHKEELGKQKEILDETFENWKNEYSNRKFDSFNELEIALSSVNKELIENKIKEAGSIITELKEKAYANKSPSISDFKEMINTLKINKEVKQQIINKAKTQVDDVIVAGVKI